MNNDFILLNKEKELLTYNEKYVFSSFPKNEVSLKIKINDTLYMLIENTIRANVNRGNIRNKYWNETKVNIIMLDFFYKVVYEKELVLKRRFLSIIRLLNEIKSIVYTLSGDNEN